VRKQVEDEEAAAETKTEDDATKEDAEIKDEGETQTTDETKEEVSAEPKTKTVTE
jgi:hypothetical protein